MRSIAKILIICIAFGMPLTVQASQAPSESFQLAQGGGKSLGEAVEQVRRHLKNGRIVKAETKIKGGREVHYIRIMEDGKVKTIKVNGRKINDRKRG